MLASICSAPYTMICSGSLEGVAVAVAGNLDIEGEGLESPRGALVKGSVSNR